MFDSPNKKLSPIQYQSESSAIEDIYSEMSDIILAINERLNSEKLNAVEKRTLNLLAAQIPIVISDVLYTEEHRAASIFYLIGILGEVVSQNLWWVSEHAEIVSRRSAKSGSIGGKKSAERRSSTAERWHREARKITKEMLSLNPNETTKNIATEIKHILGSRAPEDRSIRNFVSSFKKNKN